MSGKIIHFKTAKKQLGYARKESQASENKAKFGRDKLQISKEKFASSKFKRHLDSHKTDND